MEQINRKRGEDTIRSYDNTILTNSAVTGKRSVAVATLLVNVVIVTAIIDTKNTRAHGGRNLNIDRKLPITVDRSDAYGQPNTRNTF